MKNFATIISIGISFETMPFYGSYTSGIYIIGVGYNVAIINASYWTSVYKVSPSSKSHNVNISSIKVGTDSNYTRLLNLSSLYKQEGSFIQYESEGITYIAIRFRHYNTPYHDSLTLQNEHLFSTRNWLNEYGIETNIFHGVAVEDIIESIDNSDIEGDALTFETLQTNEMSVTLLNHDGRFDNFDNLYGNRFLVHQVYDATLSVSRREGTPLVYKNESKIVFSGFIETPEFSYLDSVTITASDIRHSYSTTLPARSFNIDDYPELENFPENVSSGEDTIDTKRTLAAGKGIVVKCTLLNILQATSIILF